MTRVTAIRGTHDTTERLAERFPISLKDSKIQMPYQDSMEKIVWEEINRLEIRKEVFDKEESISCVIADYSENKRVFYYLGFFSDFFEGNVFPSAYRKKLEILEYWGEPLGKRIRGSGLGYSAKYLLKLPSEFYEDLNQAVVAARVPLEEIKSLKDAMFKDTAVENRFNEEIYKKERVLLLPVFIEMRKKGYTNLDLMSNGPRSNSPVDPIFVTLLSKGLVSS